MTPSLWTSISPVALGITARDLVSMSPMQQAQRIRQAAIALEAIALDLERKAHA